MKWKMKKIRQYVKQCQLLYPEGHKVRKIKWRNLKMGWTNFIIIDRWKMLIEVNRSVGEIEEYITDALNSIIDSEDIDIDISNLKVSDITVKDLCILASAYENASSLSQLEIDKLFLYWLDSRNIEYDIKSEYNVDTEKYKENGYNIVIIHTRKMEKEDM